MATQNHQIKKLDKLLPHLISYVALAQELAPDCNTGKAVMDMDRPLLTALRLSALEYSRLAGSFTYRLGPVRFWHVLPTRDGEWITFRITRQVSWQLSIMRNVLSRINLRA